MSAAGTCVAALITVYRLGISPFLPGNCRFQPTCSAYALDAVRRFGAGRGALLALRRLCRCHPWGDWGFDPVPEGEGDAPAPRKRWHCDTHDTARTRGNPTRVRSG
ncbi:MAG: membrane protein insertion efficiency factor YidD [Rhodospirillales bacterium]|nr:membrane protein insertion efficiency factor YidD [Rhodospirillales bacterium]